MAERLRFALAGLWLACAMSGQTVKSILPSGVSYHLPLAPGLLMSIYGEHFGPSWPCNFYDDPKPHQAPHQVYPVELCGVQVMIGNKPAELLYVAHDQINFRVPLDVPAKGGADVVVVFQGKQNAPFPMKFGLETVMLSLEKPAYADMPVWLKVDAPSTAPGRDVRYPSALGLADFGCNEVEVSRNGVPLKTRPAAEWTRHGIFGDFVGCGSFARDAKFDHRLPLHLLYDFTSPGLYQVRYVMRNLFLQAGGDQAVLARSAWAQIEIHPRQRRQRVQWLAALKLRAPTDAGELLEDVLPSLLGIPDDASLEILLGYLYHSDSAVREYALNGLSYWPENLVSRRLKQLVSDRGSNDVTDRFFSWQRKR